MMMMMSTAAAAATMLTPLPRKKNFRQPKLIRWFLFVIIFIFNRKMFECVMLDYIVYHLCMLEIDKSVQFIVVPLKLLLCARQTMYTLHTYE